MQHIGQRIHFCSPPVAGAKTTVVLDLAPPTRGDHGLRNEVWRKGAFAAGVDTQMPYNPPYKT